MCHKYGRSTSWNDVKHLFCKRFFTESDNTLWKILRESAFALFVVMPILYFFTHAVAYSLPLSLSDIVLLSILVVLAICLAITLLILTVMSAVVLITRR